MQHPLKPGDIVWWTDNICNAPNHPLENLVNTDLIVSEVQDPWEFKIQGIDNPYGDGWWVFIPPFVKLSPAAVTAAPIIVAKPEKKWYSGF